MSAYGVTLPKSQVYEKSSLPHRGLLFLLDTARRRVPIWRRSVNAMSTENMRRVRTCKPNSVCPVACREGRAREIIIYLERPSPVASSNLPASRVRRAAVSSRAMSPGPCDAAGSCTPWGLPSRRGRPQRWCALTAPFHPLPEKRPEAQPSAGLLSVAHAITTRPSKHEATTPHRVFPLGSTVPSGVRTFLTAVRGRRSDDPVRTQNNVLHSPVLLVRRSAGRFYRSSCSFISSTVSW